MINHDISRLQGSKLLVFRFSGTSKNCVGKVNFWTRFSAGKVNVTFPTGKVKKCGEK